MQEFESISASSYDPSALATKLTAKAAEGWSVVAIVPTGGDVTAFVSRDKGGATEASMPAASTEQEAERTAEETAAPDVPAEAEASSEPKTEPVSEPSGWAIAPESSTTTPEPTGVQPTIGITPTSTYQPSVTPSYEPAPAVAPAVAAPAAAAPAVPAGWYADPAGRFELRYWDGTTWTEHVSRAGQQFTDPPVA